MSKYCTRFMEATWLGDRCAGIRNLAIARFKSCCDHQLDLLRWSLVQYLSCSCTVNTLLVSLQVAEILNLLSFFKQSIKYTCTCIYIFTNTMHQNNVKTREREKLVNQFTSLDPSQTQTKNIFLIQQKIGHVEKETMQNDYFIIH